VIKTLDRERFEEHVEKAFLHLPDAFKDRVDNVQIIVEDYPTDEQVRSLRLPSRRHLLGLYEGISLEKRGVWYGTSPTVPDRITLFQKNIESQCRSDEEVEKKIHEVLIHELAHYFGMDEEEIRSAGY
jgi:predicted Zn-dependent protease with MMP-like domain